MTTQVQFRKGTTADHAQFTGANAEITVDTKKKTAVVHDGTDVGGFELQRARWTTVATSGDLSAGVRSVKVPESDRRSLTLIRK